MSEPVFSDDWEMEAPGQPVLAMPYDMDAVALPNGGVAVLLRGIEGPAHMELVRQGLAKPTTIQVMLPPKLAAGLGKRLLEMAEPGLESLRNNPHIHSQQKH